MKTSELQGAALDWAVAKAEGKKPSIERNLIWTRGKNTPYALFQPSKDWAQGGPIIERERITIEWEGDPDSWCACITADQEVYGSTALIAAMRCFVFSKLGNEVEIPEGLA